MLDKSKREKKEDLQKLERKLVAILEAQENELNDIKRRQDEKVHNIAKTGIKMETPPNQTQLYSEKDAVAVKEKRKTVKLMDSTETMMKFGFMSMAMTYFTSMNMVGAMKNASIGEMDGMDNFNFSIQNANDRKDVASLSPGIHSSNSDVMKWNVENVVQWLSAIYLSQYEESFRDASIDGPFLCQLTDEDLQDALGIGHKLHRKKILFGIDQLKIKISSPSISSERTTASFTPEPVKVCRFLFTLLLSVKMIIWILTMNSTISIESRHSETAQSCPPRCGCCQH